MNKKFVALLITGVMALTMTACGSPKEEVQTDKPTEESDFYAAMISDTGGINDEGFNQSAWEGLQEFEAKTGAKISFLESSQASDYATNLDRFADEEADIILGVGYNMSEDLLEAASMNPEYLYAIVDHDYGDETPDNVINLSFAVQDSSFLVGYIAGLTTETDHVGYLGGEKNPTMDYFEYGFRAGVEYAAAELGKEITVDIQIAESFTDAAKGKAIAASMYNAGADIIFQAAGSVGIGAIEQAVESDKWIIGVDRDQLYLAPENILTSALKTTGIATSQISEDVLEGKDVGGQTFEFGLSSGAVGIPKENPNIEPAIYEKLLLIEEEISAGNIITPHNEETYAEFDAAH